MKQRSNPNGSYDEESVYRLGAHGIAPTHHPAHPGGASTHAAQHSSHAASGPGKSQPI